MASRIRRSRLVGIAAGAAVVVGGHAGALAFFAHHDPYGSTVFPPCPWLALTGWQCPACGGTRAAYSLLHDGDPVASWAMNPLVIVLYAVAALVAGGLLAHRANRIRLGNALIWTVPAVLGATLLYTGVVRNLLGE